MNKIRKIFFYSTITACFSSSIFFFFSILGFDLHVIRPLDLFNLINNSYWVIVLNSFIEGFMIGILTIPIFYRILSDKENDKLIRGTFSLSLRVSLIVLFIFVVVFYLDLFIAEVRNIGDPGGRGFAFIFGPLFVLFYSFSFLFFYIIISFVMSWLCRYLPHIKFLWVLYILILFIIIVAHFFYYNNYFCPARNNDCIVKIAVEKNNLEICNKALKTQRCMLDYAKLKDDISVCNVMPWRQTDIYPTSECYAYFAKNKNNPSICQKIESENKVLESIGRRDCCSKFFRILALNNNQLIECGVEKLK